MSNAIKLTVAPRVQYDRWNLYWKDSMSTRTEICEDVEVTVASTDTLEEVASLVANALQWCAKEESYALEGFAGKWERLLYKGRELDFSTKIADLKLEEDYKLVLVRQQLVAEGWRIRIPGQEDYWSDTSDEDDARLYVSAVST